MIRELIEKNRSYRRFSPNGTVAMETLRELVDLARLSPSSANLQPLRFILSSDPEKNALIFKHLSWAGYLKDWDGPAESETPSAYIIIIGDTVTSQRFLTDSGIAAQSIMLGAAQRGLGGCMIGSIDRPALRSDLGISVRYDILLILALGVPAEKVVIEQEKDENDIKYWRSEDDVHHVPKRPLDELIIN